MIKKVLPENRPFSKDRELASRAGKKGAEKSNDSRELKNVKRVLEGKPIKDLKK